MNLEAQQKVRTDHLKRKALGSCWTWKSEAEWHVDAGPVARWSAEQSPALRLPLGLVDHSEMVLCLRQGMTAWRRACSQCTSAVAETSPPASDSGTALPADLRSEVARILAGMAWSSLHEASR